MNPPKYPGDIEFQKVLNEMEFNQDIYSVKSFVAGYVWGIDLIQPSTLIERLLGKGTEDEIALENEDQLLQFYGGIMGLWNEFASQNKKVVNSLRPLPRITDEKDVLLLFLSELATDMNNFLGALMDTGSLRCSDSEVNGLENEIVETSETIEEILQEYFEVSISVAKREELYESLLLCHKKWKKIFPSMGKALDRYRKQAIAAQRHEVELSPVPKIGRNEPCLCGSGKKYKKCCMLTVVH